MNITIDTRKIIDRLKKALSIRTDEQLAIKLGLSQSTVANWKSRNNIDYTLIFESFPDLDFNYLIKGISNSDTVISQNVISDSGSIKLQIENDLLREQLREQREDYIKSLERLSSNKQELTFEANTTKAG